MTTTEPNPPPPPGRTTLSDWNDWDGLYRFIWGESTRPEGTRFLIAAFAMQLPDGLHRLRRRGGRRGGSRPGIEGDKIGDDGRSYERLTVTIEGVRRLAAALLEAVAEIDRGAGR